MTLLTPPIQVGLLGCGQIGRLHAQRLQTDPRAELVALFDTSSDTAESLRQEFAPAARNLGSLEEFWCTEGMDAVVIATPTSEHAQQVREAWDRGLCVLCEKPLADNLADITDLVLRSSRGAPLTLAYQRRFQAFYRTIRREVLSGEWGPVRAVASLNSEHWLQWQCLPGTWRADPSRNPWGYLGDAGSHKVDALFFCSGLEPLSVQAVNTSPCEVPMVTQVAACLGKRSGEQVVPVSMSFIGLAHHFSEYLHISCEKADWIIRGNELLFARENEIRPWTDFEPESNPVSGWLDHLTNRGVVNLSPASAAIPVYQMTEGILQAASEHREITIDEILSPL